MSDSAVSWRPDLGGAALLIVLTWLATAVVLSSTPARFEETVSADASLPERLAQDLSDLPPDRVAGRSGHAHMRKWIGDQLTSLGLELTEHSEPGRDDDGGPTHSLVATIPGDAKGERTIFVTTHYDTVPGTPGADDNGSGCVALMELARRLSEMPADATVRLVWFDGEERMLLGSRRFATALTAAERQAVIGVINLESIGYMRTDPGSQRLPPGVKTIFDPGDTGDFILLVGNVSSRLVLERVAASFRRTWVGFGRVESFGWVPGTGWILPDVRRSDHAPFWDVGVPAVLVTDTAEFRNPHYHRPSDRPETLDYDFLANVTRGVEQAVRELATR